MLGLGLSLVSIAVRQLLGGAFTPAILFGTSDQGVWYDPSDFSTLFQDSAGTTPVTALEQPVGRMLDKSGKGNHATQPTATSRPVVSARVNQYLNTETLATQSVTTAATSYTLRFEGTGTVTLSGAATGTYSAGTHTITCTAGTLTSTVAGSVTKADLRVANDGAGIPSYQRVNTATDYDSTGFPVYLRADGVDDGMVTNSIDFTANDKMTVVAGVRKLSDAVTYATVVELSAIYSSNNGSFTLNTPWQDRNFAAGVRGTNFNNFSTDAGTQVAPSSYVATCLYDIGGATTSDELNLRLNGVLQSGARGGDPSTGNFGNYPLYLFRRGGTTAPFNGRFYGLTIVNKLLSTTELEQLETYTNGKTKAFA
jgi:hypothetical protein